MERDNQQSMTGADSVSRSQLRGMEILMPGQDSGVILTRKLAIVFSCELTCHYRHRHHRTSQ